MHVFHDLRPYVCLADNCPALLETFSTRDAWAEHDRTHSGTVTFVCSSCPCTYHTPGQLEAHLFQTHHELTSEQRHESMSTAIRPQAEDFGNRSCPLCHMSNFPSTHKFRSHVCQHLEDIALATVPSELYPDDDADSVLSAHNSTSTPAGDLDRDSVVLLDEDYKPSSELIEIRQSFARLDTDVQKEAVALELEYPASLVPGTRAAAPWAAATRLKYGRATQQLRAARYRLQELVNSVYMPADHADASNREGQVNEYDNMVLTCNNAIDEIQDVLKTFKAEQESFKDYRESALHEQKISCPEAQQRAERFGQAAWRSSSAYDGMNSRMQNVRTAIPGTCSWILRHPYYQEWAVWSDTTDHRGILWIRGKPGAGKTTLMKYLFEWTKQNRLEEVSVQYFSNARSSSTLNKSCLGLYRSILHQLLSSLPTSPELITPFFTKELDLDVEEWTVRELRQTLINILLNRQCPEVNIFIDALDEGADMDDIRQMVADLDGLLAHSSPTPKKGLRICLASRHYPHIYTPNSLVVVLEDQEGHAGDMKMYTETMLRGRRGDPEMDILREEVCRKSGGLFLWVVLVVARLNNAYDDGQSITTLVRMIQELPADLYTLQQIWGVS